MYSGCLYHLRITEAEDSSFDHGLVIKIAKFYKINEIYISHLCTSEHFPDSASYKTFS